MQYGARPLRSTRRLANNLGQRPGWYAITNAASAGLPTQVSIYDEIGFFGVAAGEFMADLKGVGGDIELHINSPGGDVHDGIAIYNQLKQRAGQIHVIIDGLAASAASFIAQAASPGRLEIAPHAQMMIHNGFSMAIGDANDLRKTADLLDTITGEIAEIYAERSGKPADFWLAQMAAETWYTDQQAVDAGLADNIHGQAAPSAQWDLSVYGRAPANAVPGSVRCDGCGKYNAPAAEKCASCGKSMVRDEDGNGAPDGDGQPDGPADASTGPSVQNADGDGTSGGGSPVEAKPLGDGWVQDPDGQVRYDPDGDGDDDSQAASDADHSHWTADGEPRGEIPPYPRSDVQDPVPSRSSAAETVGDRAGMFPVLNADVDRSEWDGGRAMSNAAKSDDPGAFYKAICAGRRAGDPDNQDSWALPYRYTPSSAPNADGVANALARLPQTKGLTNADEAKSKLQGLMKSINPDYDPDALLDPAVLASALTAPAPDVDSGPWDALAVVRSAMSSANRAGYFRAVCAGRLPGNPASPDAWALPYRRTPDSPPNATAVRAALAALPRVEGLVNRDEARNVLDQAMRAINAGTVPDDGIDPALLSAAFAGALG